MPAGSAYPSGHLVPFPIMGLACAPIVETNFLELVMSLLDFSPRYIWPLPLGTFSILLLFIIFITYAVCVLICMTSPIGVSFKCVSFLLQGCCGEWEGWARKPVNYTSWVAVVTPIDRPMSARNRCVVELFCGVVCVVTLLFWHFYW